MLLYWTFYIGSMRTSSPKALGVGLTCALSSTLIASPISSSSTSALVKSSLMLTTACSAVSASLHSLSANSTSSWVYPMPTMACCIPLCPSIGGGELVVPCGWPLPCPLVVCLFVLAMSGPEGERSRVGDRATVCAPTIIGKTWPRKLLAYTLHNNLSPTPSSFVVVFSFFLLVSVIAGGGGAPTICYIAVETLLQFCTLPTACTNLPFASLLLMLALKVNY